MNLCSWQVLGWASAGIAATALAACCGDASDERVQSIDILSGRADMVSGGDALVEVKVKSGQDPSRVRVTLNGQDVTSAFATRADGRFKAIVTGLKLGVNELAATYSAGPGTALTIHNHSIGGPLFSGPQIQPWTCETQSFGLGASMDSQCNAPAQVRYVYRSTDAAKSGLLPFDPSNPPADVAAVTTDAGVTVPFIVRIETGTANRGIYALAVVADPAHNLSPFNPPRGWNGSLIYAFQGGALPQYRQGPIDADKITGYNNPTDTVLDLVALSKGYAVVNNTLNHFAQNTNSVVSAETAVMMKEKVVKTLGELKFTIGTGASGGSIQQNLILNGYPGIIDGAIVNATYPDVWSANTEVQDCSLLARHFDNHADEWADVRMQNAVMNNADMSPGTCRAWSRQVHNLDAAWMDPSSVSCFNANPTLTVPQSAKHAWEFDASSNPSGARCTLQDYQVNIFGKRPDGYAERPYDNIGVQYGLAAFNAGVISAEQFVSLNEGVGGRDINWNWTAARTEASQLSLERVYRSGQYNLFSNAQSTPIIDVRACFNSEIHSCFSSFKLRERLKAAVGSTGSSLLLMNKPPSDTVDLVTMERWLTAIKADLGTEPLSSKVLRHRPSDATDSCWIGGARTTDLAACSAAYPYYGDPRMGAGAPITLAAAKCQLAPLSRESYNGTFSDEQWQRLNEAFPYGICDWSRPGVAQSAAIPWLSYATGPGGQPIAPAPTSLER